MRAERLQYRLEEFPFGHDLFNAVQVGLDDHTQVLVNLPKHGICGRILYGSEFFPSLA